ncbi:hypothetical protein GXW78_19775 [Roseomonas terrae]|uniref:Uncharacterized protein n=1 Tax=Neoroseomonas terrae TaxID=424799 RepID=A0ABS5ELK4_9PROT|nr:hypothetical protein [Neoroseomonas terrae]MBR0651916.1 hypothetical protein [Neoroseomonas terrae]
MSDAIRVHSLSPKRAFPPEGVDLGDAYRQVAAGGAEVIVVNADFSRSVGANLADALAMPAVRDALDRGAALLFDSTREGRPFHLDIARDLHGRVEAAGVGAGRCVYLTQNVDFAAPYAAWCTESGRTGFAVHVMHAHLRVLAARARRSPPSPPGWTGTDDARFLCLNRRITPHRVVLLGYLHATGALGRGLVSALQPVSEPVLPPRWERRFPQEMAAFRSLAPRLPLTLPETQRQGHVFGWETGWYETTAFSFVTETDFDTAGVCRFTEKSLKPLMAGHPMLVAGLPGTLALLRRYGFRTFEPLLHEEYDAIPDPTQRMRTVLAEFDRLMLLPEAALRALVAELRPVVAHNMAWFRTGLPERLATEDAAVRTAIAGAAGRR